MTTSYPRASLQRWTGSSLSSKASSASRSKGAPHLLHWTQYPRQSPRAITVAQTGYRRTLLSRFATDIAKVKRVQKTPAPPWILQPAPASDPPYDKTHYLSMIMSIMFLARLTRADILFMCVYLATFTSAPRSALVGVSLALLHTLLLLFYPCHTLRLYGIAN